MSVPIRCALSGARKMIQVLQLEDVFHSGRLIEDPEHLQLCQYTALLFNF